MLALSYPHLKSEQRNKGTEPPQMEHLPRSFEKGKKEGIRVYQFLKEPIERYFGEDFYQAMDQAAKHING